MRGVPSFNKQMPELGIWHLLGTLMRQGLVQPWDWHDMTVEMVVFYQGELEAEAKLQEAAIKKMKSNTKKHRMH